MSIASLDDMTFPPPLLSTTAPGKVFPSRSELQNHYRSEWHRYNLRRREAGLPMLNEHDFASRWEAALALRKEREGREERCGDGHRKDRVGTSDDKEKKKKKVEKPLREGGMKRSSRRRKPAFATERGGITIEDVRVDDAVVDNDDAIIEGVEGGGTTVQVEMMVKEEDDEGEDPPEINPCQCPFDSHISPTHDANLEYMKATYSFFLPDSEYIIDLEGFLGYCNEKVRWGNACLYCQKTFTTAEGTLKHMRDKRHCKVLYERNVDMEEYDVFYDFSGMLPGDGGGENDDIKRRKKKKNHGHFRNIVHDSATYEREGGDTIDEDEEEWEDVVSDNDEDASMAEGENDDTEDDIYASYEREVHTQGIDITPLGELIFPDGRIVGHRGLARYYKQRYAPDRMERTAVRYAREAAGDRLYHGRVVNLQQLYGEDAGGGGGGGGRGNAAALEGGINTATALAIMGRISGSVPTGRNGKGVLVSAGGDGGGNKGGFTSLSLYRYRAAVKKQRKEDDRGRRLQYRQTMNMNKMNKKGNNITTGVVTSQQPR